MRVCKPLLTASFAKSQELEFKLVDEQDMMSMAQFRAFEQEIAAGGAENPDAGSPQDFRK
jgi:hypothetical protein